MPTAILFRRSGKCVRILATSDPMEAVRLARKPVSLRLVWLDPRESDEARVLHEIIGWMLAVRIPPREIAEILLRAGMFQETLAAGTRLRRRVKMKT